MTAPEKPDSKLIVPTEVRVCATCSYWDGERRFDEDVRVVVVSECCKGECLVREHHTPCLNPARDSQDCAWESLHLTDEPEDPGQG